MRDGRTNKQQGKIELLSFWSVRRWVSQYWFQQTFYLSKTYKNISNGCHLLSQKTMPRKGIYQPRVANYYAHRWQPRSRVTSPLADTAAWSRVTTYMPKSGNPIYVCTATQICFFFANVTEHLFKSFGTDIGNIQQESWWENFVEHLI